MANVTNDKKNKINGVGDELYDKAYNSSYTPSDEVKRAQTEASQAASNVKNLTNQKNIISSNTQKKLNSQFKMPRAVTEADTYLSAQLQKIQSGRTSYSDQVRDMMDKIMNRVKFSYDVDTDPLFQQALASAMKSGKQAMTDTIGQASALTGGYGSTYATSAGNQAYNAFIEDAYNNLPQYYQMALEAYQMEGDEMYRQFGMVSELDDKEFSRNIAAYDATSQYRNRAYDESYGRYRDSMSDAHAMANLELNVHGQRVSDAVNYYNMANEQSNILYEREYNSWMDSINQAMEAIKMGNTDYWNQINFDEGVRQYEKNYAQNEDHFTRTQQFQASEAQKDRDFQASENAKNRSVKVSGGSGSGSGSGSGKVKEPSSAEKTKALEAYNKGGTKAYEEYLDSLPSNINVDSIDAYVFGYIDEETGEKAQGYGVLPYSDRTYTVVDDGGNNWGWGVDNNAVVVDEYGNKFTLKELAKYDEEIAKELSKKSYTTGKIYKKQM